MPHPNSTSTPISSPSGTPSAPWQGAAFNSLNRNVAAPTIAPTSCLKIRHMFDPQNVRVNSPRASNNTSGSNTGWIWHVKEEILRRCAATSPPATILHIAVDTENAEADVQPPRNDRFCSVCFGEIGMGDTNILRKVDDVNTSWPHFSVLPSFFFQLF